jgi:hypothetical protein
MCAGKGGNQRVLEEYDTKHTVSTKKSYKRGRSKQSKNLRPASQAFDAMMLNRLKDIDSCLKQTPFVSMQIKPLGLSALTIVLLMGLFQAKSTNHKGKLKHLIYMDDEMVRMLAFRNSEKHQTVPKKHMTKRTEKNYLEIPALIGCLFNEEIPLSNHSKMLTYLPLLIHDNVKTILGKCRLKYPLQKCKHQCFIGHAQEVSIC